MKGTIAETTQISTGMLTLDLTKFRIFVKVWVFSTSYPPPPDTIVIPLKIGRCKTKVTGHQLFYQFRKYQTFMQANLRPNVSIGKWLRLFLLW